MKLLYPLALLASCSLIPDTLTGGPTAVPSIPSVDTIETVTSSAWRFAWLSLLLLIFLPGVKRPLLTFWTAVFRALSIPFMAVRDWYESKQ